MALAGRIRASRTVLSMLHLPQAGLRALVLQTHSLLSVADRELEVTKKGHTELGVDDHIPAQGA